MSKGRKIARIVGVALGVLVVAAGTGFWLASSQARAKLERHFEAHTVDFAVPNPLTQQELDELRAERAKTLPPAVDGEAAADPLAGVDLPGIALERAIARGKHLVEARYACGACHGANFAGGVMIDNGAIGTIRGANLTSGKGGLPANYAVADWDRIVRHGIKPDGSPAVMPSEDFFAMTDQELSDVIAYLRSQPSVDAEVPKPTFGPVGTVLLAVGKFPLAAYKLGDHQRPHAKQAPDAANTPEFGAHLAAICTGCHRENLAGGPMLFGPPDWPAAANLTHHEAGLSSWSFDDFERALVHGKSKDGRALRPPMSEVVPATRAMTATERKALWTYLASVQPMPTNP
ncbi:MAG: c-type cytochrome [Myxococcales bacterium]